MHVLQTGISQAKRIGLGCTSLELLGHCSQRVNVLFSFVSDFWYSHKHFPWWDPCDWTEGILWPNTECC